MNPIPSYNILKRSHPNEGVDPWKWISCAVMLAISFVVFYTLALRGGSDISIHATWAAEGDFLQPRTFFRHGAHPLWHVLTAAMMLTGMPVKMAGAAVTALLKAVELLFIHKIISLYTVNHVGKKNIALAAFCAALVTALWVPQLNETIYLGVGSPNTWHNPTQMISMVTMLVCVPYTAYCLVEFEKKRPLQGKRTILPWKTVLTLGFLLLLSLTAKPTFMQAFLPAAGLLFLAKWLRYKENSRFFGQVLLAVLPSMLLMVAQYLFYFSDVIVPMQGGVSLQISWEKVTQVLVGSLLMRAFPLYVLVAFKSKDMRRDPLLTLTLLLDLVGISEYLLLGETGRRMQDGNFGWAMMGGALMLWVLMLSYFMRNHALCRTKRPAWIFAGGFALLLWHVGSGIYYLIYLIKETGVVL